MLSMHNQLLLPRNPSNFAPVGVTPIDPASFAETHLLWDGGDNTTVLKVGDVPAGDLDAVYKWQDKANGVSPCILSSSSSIYYPKYRTSTGLIYFENDRQRDSGGWPGNFSTVPVTVFAAFKFVPDAVSAQTLFDGVASYDMAVRIANSGSGVLTMGSNGTTFSTSNTITYEDNFIGVFEFNGASSGMWLSPKLPAHTPFTETGVVGTDTMSGIKVGSDGTGSNRLRNGSGFLYLTVIKKVLTAAEKDGVGTFLANNSGGELRWGFELS